MTAAGQRITDLEQQVAALTVRVEQLAAQALVISSSVRRTPPLTSTTTHRAK